MSTKSSFSIGKILLLAPLFIVILIATILIMRYANFDATVKPISAYNPPATQKLPDLSWLGYGQAAIASSSSILASNNTDNPSPTASTAKAILALAIMRAKPFTLPDQGETITITQQDVNIYWQTVAANGSNTPVRVGTELTQYQALESVLIRSSNNMADSLAIWAFGSLEKYTTYANNMLQEYGIKNTTVGSDASGLSPDTTSTASDLAMIGQLLLQNPVLAQIVAKTESQIPVAGTIKNTNPLLSYDDVVGIKTGYTSAAGGTYILGATLHGQNITVAVMGADQTAQAIEDSYQIFSQLKDSISPTTLVKEGDTVAYYHPKWSTTAIPVTATKTIEANILPGEDIKYSINLPDITPDSTGQIGDLTLSVQGKIYIVPLTVPSIPSPSVWYKAFN